MIGRSLSHKLGLWSTPQTINTFAVIPLPRVHSILIPGLCWGLYCQRQAGAWLITQGHRKYANSSLSCVRAAFLMATISPAAAAAQEAALLQLVTDSQTTNYLSAAGLTFLIIEHISTFKEEIRYVWQSRLSLWSVLYVWTRYFTLISLAMDVSFMFRPMRASEIRCRQFLLAEMTTSIMIIISVDCILVLRVWLLFGKGRKLLGILIPLLIVEMAGMITFGLLAILPLKDFADVGPFLNGCYSLEVPRLLTFVALPPFLMSLLMFSMTAYKCGQHLRLRSRRAPMPMITLFLRDGVFLFLWIMLYSTAELIIWHSARPTLAEIPIVPATAVSAVLGGRILLNIKNLAYDNSNANPTIELTTLSQQHLSAPLNRGNRIPWYLQTGEVKDVRNSEEM
ncbi:hypothetical protein FB45DRAFT_4758 [Roridomyces roridus]|uniref:DUF6533 domain-containing protein n=1 Tax=Roridomyces roridus TaxID=1738132 RepID=A0AAD7CI67_9AGAR|nr:hypothetical protein FB45DRAFT_4758 [Roridomyces roridus]